MAFKMKGSKFYGKGNQSPAKKKGIYMDITDEAGKITKKRISKDKADRLEMIADKGGKAVSITKTGDDSPDFTGTDEQIKHFKEQGDLETGEKISFAEDAIKQRKLDKEAEKNKQKRIDEQVQTK